MNCDNLIIEEILADQSPPPSWSLKDLIFRRVHGTATGDPPTDGSLLSDGVRDDSYSALWGGLRSTGWPGHHLRAGHQLQLLLETSLYPLLWVILLLSLESGNKPVHFHAPSNLYSITAERNLQFWASISPCSCLLLKVGLMLILSFYNCSHVDGSNGGDGWCHRNTNSQTISIRT